MVIWARRIPRDLLIFMKGLLRGLPRTDKLAKRRLFVDCGSNVGQGFRYFRKMYPMSLYDFVLIEPNPNCIASLRRDFDHLKNVTILEAAAWVETGELDFFGLSEDQDQYSVGGSVIEDHNASMYEVDVDSATRVPAIDFAKKFNEIAADYEQVILKMDIESAEYTVLPHFLEKAKLDNLDHAYIEFHTRFMEEPEKSENLAIENQIIATLKSRSIPHTVWY